jgi:cytochrome c553
MHKPLRLVSALMLGALALWSGSAAAAGNAEAGAQKSMFCAGCHGADGNMTHTGTPRLAGQSEAELIAKLKMYKSNQKMFHPMMAFLTGGLNDQDIQDLAAFYAKQPVRQSLQPYRGITPYQ